jgi:hypothetical protein
MKYEKVIIRKFLILSSLIFIIIILFFIYRSYFKLWGKRFKDMNSVLFYGDLLFFIAEVLWLYFYRKFIKENAKIISEWGKFKKKHKTNS